MDINEETSLKEMFQGMIPDGAGVIRGKVTSASPLVIQADNDPKLILNANNLCVPRHLTNYSTTCTISTTGPHGHAGCVVGSGHSGDGTHAHTNATITVFNALKTGEAVFLLSFNEGKKYYVLDREG